MALASKAHTASALAVLLVMVAFTYSPSLNGPFQFDDWPVIVDSPALHITDLSMASLATALVSPHSSNRPIANLTLALNYYYGGLNTRYYHVVNLLIHLLSVVVLYHLVHRILTLPALRGSYTPASRRIAMVTATLWGLHPVQTQAVSYIVQRMTSQATFFYLLALLCYIAAKQTDHPRHKLLHLGCAMLSGFLALGSKEIAITLPLAIVILEGLLFRSPDSTLAPRQQIVIGTTVLMLLGAGLTVYFSVLFNLTSLTTAFALRPAFQPLPFTHRLLTESRVIVHYLSLLLFPSPSRLVVDDHIPPSTSLVDPPTTLLSIILLAALIYLGFRQARRSPLLSFCIAWFFLNITIEAITPFLDLAAEHRLYLPSIGPILLVTLGIERFWQILGDRRLQIGLPRVATIIGLAAVLALATWQRNLVWADETTLWLDTVRKAPLNSRAHFNLGFAYGKRDRLDPALEAFNQALTLRPDYPEAYFGRGFVLGRQGHVEAAIRNIREALRLHPDYHEARTNLAVLYHQIAEPENAMEELRRVIASNPTYAKAHYALATILSDRGDLNGAIAEFRDALRSEPGMVDAYNNLGIVYGRQGRLELAILAFEKAIALEPGRADAHFNLGLAYQERGQPSRALQEYRQALTLKPGWTQVAAQIKTLEPP